MQQFCNGVHGERAPQALHTWRGQIAALEPGSPLQEGYNQLQHLSPLGARESPEGKDHVKIQFCQPLCWDQAWELSCSVVSTLIISGLKPARLPCPWDFSGKNTGVGCYFLFPPTRDLPDSGIESVSPAAPALQADSLPLSHQGNLRIPH